MKSVVIFSCKVFCRYVNISKHYVSTNPTKKMLIGVLPVMPNVYAQSKMDDPRADINSTNENDSKPNHKAGWEGLKNVFIRDEFGNMSKELTATIQTTSISFIIGLLYGGVKSSRVAFIDFMERNQATIFENHLDAKRRLQNHVTIHFGKGAIRWGTKLSCFSGGFMLFLTSISAYRGSVSAVDYMISGTLVGALIRSRLGPPAMVVGGALGCILGLFCGFSTQGLLSIWGSNFDEVLAFQYEIDHTRQKLFKEAEKISMEKSLNAEALELLKGRESHEKK